MKKAFTLPSRMGAKNHPGQEDLGAIKSGVRTFLELPGADGRRLGHVKHCVYAVYGSDGRPLFLDYSVEPFRLRIERHLTEPATSIAGLRAFEPCEIVEVEVWPLDGVIARAGILDHAECLDRALYEAFGSVLRESPLHCILTQREREQSRRLLLPQSTRQQIIPHTMRFHHTHFEERLARSAKIFAALARDISLRRIARAHRASMLALSKRLDRFASALP